MKLHMKNHQLYAGMGAVECIVQGKDSSSIAAERGDGQRGNDVSVNVEGEAMKTNA